MPGAQATAEVSEQRVYPRLQSFILHALMQVRNVSSSAHLTRSCMRSTSDGLLSTVCIDAVCTVVGRWRCERLETVSSEEGVYLLVYNDNNSLVIGRASENGRRGAPCRVRWRVAARRTPPSSPRCTAPSTRPTSPSSDSARVAPWLCTPPRSLNASGQAESKPW